jgi:hypothetical protein
MTAFQSGGTRWVGLEASRIGSQLGGTTPTKVELIRNLPDTPRNSQNSPIWLSAIGFVSISI